MNKTMTRPLTAIFCTLCFGACVPADDAEVQHTTQALTAGSNPVVQEPESHTTGKFREVVNTPGCTGTIIGPHAVLTARHCSATTGNINWSASSESLPFTNSVQSPYTQSNYFPAWWRALNQDQIDAGIRTTDWPAQHDLRVLLVPGLDEDQLTEYIAANDFQPMRVDPYATSTQRYIVGMSDATFREYARVDGFLPVTQNPWFNTVACHNQPGNTGNCVRDGYYRLDGSVSTNPGDSGGPTLGVREYSRNGTTAGGFRHVIAATSNAAGDIAPLSYDSNQTLTTRQKSTIRLNQLWVKSMASDADRDHLPYECDPNPAAWSTTNLCISGFGKLNSSIEPRGLLQCKEGFAVTGIKGRQGWLIDQMAVRCTPLSCLEKRHAACTTSQSYWTDHFGGETNGGTPFEKTCDVGKAITDVGARHTVNSTVHEIRPYCRDFKDSVLSQTSASAQSLGTIGNSAGARSDGTNVPWQRCPNFGYVKGFEVRSKSTGTNVMNYISGIQTVCSGEVNRSPFTGEFGGQVNNLECPKGYVAFGVSARANYANDLGVFGLLCRPESDVVAGQYVNWSRVVVAHGSAFDQLGYYPANRKRYYTFTAQNNNLTTRYCSNNQSLRGASFYRNGLFKQLRYIQCENHSPSTFSTSTTWANVGTASGTAVGTYCGVNESVTGMLLHSGWASDGVSFSCKAQ